MTIHASIDVGRTLADETSVRPSRRKFIGRWTAIDTPQGVIRVCPAPNHWYSKMWIVIVNGEWFYGDIVELDELWAGRTPDALGLDLVEDE